jgi:hypothetical protein
VVGAIGFETLRVLLPDSSTWDWILAGDIMEPAQEELLSDMPLQEALDNLTQTAREAALVVSDSSRRELCGILNRSEVQRQIHQKLLQQRGGR